MEVLIKIRPSDIELMQLMVDYTEDDIIIMLTKTVEDIHRIYGNYITVDKGFRRGKYDKGNYRCFRSFKIPGKRKGFPLYYTLFYRDETKTTLCAVIATKRSWLGDFRNGKAIYDKMATDAIEDMLMQE